MTIMSINSRLPAAKNPVQPTSAETVLATLTRTHPRLILRNKRLSELKRLMVKDPLLRKCRDDVLKQADDYCTKGPLVYRIPDGIRLLGVSRRCLSRVYALGLAWRLTGKEKYARKAKENLLTVCAFKDWNPSHFLDTAEMSHAVGVGYDWLFSYLGKEARAKIRAALIKNGLEPGLTLHKKGTWQVTSYHNWNQVCNGGLIIGALAVAETDPKYAGAIIPKAVEFLPRALGTYEPDGAWPEGPGYWDYATRYTVYALAAMETALGDDFGLSQMRGISETGLFPIYACGPTNLYFNFADVGDRSRRRKIPCLFWLARTYDRPVLAEAERRMLAKYAADPLDFIWYVPPGKTKPPAPALDKRFRGSVEVAVFRSAWNDRNALFVAVKAGYNQVNHGHLDLGNFEIDALGVRWARDLGKENYNLPGYWNKGKDAKRWTYYRMRSISHNVPILGGRDQDVYAKTKITRFKSSPSEAFAVLDLTSAYKDFSQKVMRGVAMVANRRAVLIQDEFDIKKSCEVAWGMTTDAEIAVEKKGRAVLTIRGKKLIARILSPARAQFTVESAEQKPPLKPNKGVKRLMIRLKKRKGSVRIAVLLAPAWPDAKPPEPPQLKALAEW